MNTQNDILMHYGTPRHSGRYPWGSGEEPYQHEPWFNANVAELKAKGMSEKDIAEGFGMTTTELRNRLSAEKNAQRVAKIKRATELKDKGYSNVKIGEMMGLNESSVRSLLDPVSKERALKTSNTADAIKEVMKTNGGYLDVGIGVEKEVGVTEDRLKKAIDILKKEGYELYYVPVEQLGTGKKTTIKVLAPPGTTFPEVMNNKGEIKSFTKYTEDGGKTFTDLNILPPKSIDSDRVMIRYNEDGGIDKDGVIELRRGIEDISLGGAHYAQVRIAVDDTHYMKGMAMYSDNMPDGIDIVYNSNKHIGTPKEKVFKPLKEDLDNPFGATIKKGGQRFYDDPNGDHIDILTGKKQSQSVINIVNEEGDWNKWQKILPSQFLSKQNLPLIKKQLDLTYAEKKAEYDEIMSLTNPAVKKKLLEGFADDCDSSAVHLKATGLPRQAGHVILPITTLKETEIYAPKYQNGEHVILIRYPHGGTFEIPELVVNNKHKDAKSLLGNAIDAVGINSKVAERLSGADFDGDTVMVIPVNDRVKIKTSKPLAGLKDFDPKEAYPGYSGMPKMKSQTKQTEMGKVSNLITDMTLKGAGPDELARAVRHSMVVIDAEKHGLDYKRSEIENGIPELKKRYQGSEKGGASTLISQAKGTVRVPERKEGYKPDPLTGEKIFRETGRTYKDKNGKVVKATTESTKMAETKDAFTLSSGTAQESYYATYANKLKALANQARKEAYTTPSIKQNASAKETYKAEVESLNSKLTFALKNAPRERQAQLAANIVVEAKKKSNPDMDKDSVKKLKTQALAASRARYDASKTDRQIVITPREWEAIQSGALSQSKVMDILDNTDSSLIRQYATPHQSSALSDAKISRIKAMDNSGYTIAEIATQLGYSTSTISKYLKE